MDFSIRMKHLQIIFNLIIHWITKIFINDRNFKIRLKMGVTR